MLYRLIIFSALTCMLVVKSNGQTHRHLYDDETLFNYGLQFIQSNNPGAAKEHFERYIESCTNCNPLKVQDANYYIAYSNLQLSIPNAEIQFLEYLDNNIETALSKHAYYDLSSYYFKKKKYTSVYKWGKRVKPEELSTAENIEHNFQMGYAYFIKKKFDKSLPYFKNISEIQGKYYYPANYYYGFIEFYSGNYSKAYDRFQKIKDSKLYASVVPYYLAQIHFMRNELDKSLSILEPLIDNNSVKYQDEVKLLYGQILFKQGDYNDAHPFISEYVENQKKVSKQTVYRLGFALYKSQQYETAIPYLEDLASDNDTIAQNALYCLSDCYIKTGQKEQARNAYASSAKLNFDPIIQETALFNYAKISYELGFQREAIQGLKQYQKEYPKGIFRTESYELITEAYLKTSDYTNAIAAIEKSPEKSPKINKAYQRITYLKAVESFNNGDLKEAKSLLSKSLKTPSDISTVALARFLEGEIAYKENRYNDAANNFIKYTELQPSIPSSYNAPNRFMANYNVAYSKFKSFSFSTALNYFEVSLRNAKQEAPDNMRLDALTRAGDCAFLARRNEKAKSFYRQITTERLGGEDYAYLQLARIYGLENNFGAQVEAYQKVASINSKSFYADDALFELGGVHLLVGDFTAAEKAFDRLINDYSYSPYLSNAYLQKGLIAFNQRQYDQALNIYKKVHEDYPNTPEDRSALASIKEVYIAKGSAKDYLSYVKNNTDIDLSKGGADSISYLAIEELMVTNDCKRIVPALNEYLTDYPKGIFVSDIRFYRADCLLKQKQPKAAFDDLQWLINQNNLEYKLKALEAATEIAYLDLADTNLAHDLYQQLYDLAANPAQKDQSTIGLMRTFYHKQDFDKAIQYSDEVLSCNSCSENVKLEARFTKGKAAYIDARYNIAQVELSSVSQLSNSAIGAEASYLTAQIDYIKTNYQKSLDRCFEIKDKVADYEKWLVYTYVLIAKNYAALDNYFQAKATLKSILDNYEGDAQLIDLTQQTLTDIEAAEQTQSKIITPENQDSLETIQE